jgi:hypothetical protein
MILIDVACAECCEAERRDSKLAMLFICSLLHASLG